MAAKPPRYRYVVFRCHPRIALAAGLGGAAQGVGDQRVRGAVRIARDPADRHAPNPLLQVGDLVSEHNQAGVARSTHTREMRHEQAAVAASVNSVQAEPERTMQSR